MALFGGAVIPKANVAQRGGRWTPIELGRYPIQGQLVQSVDYRFYKYSESTSVISGDEVIMIDIPIHHLVVRLQNRQLVDVAKAHNIPCNGRVCRNKTQLKKAILDHRCIKCPSLKPFFVPVEAVHTNSQRQKDKRAKHILPIAEPTIPSTEKSDTQFPPSPPSQDLLDDIIRGFSKDLQLSNFVEGPCTVCGLLSLTTSLTPLSEAKVSLNILVPDVPITRKERFKAADPIINIPGLVLLPKCDNVCKTCLTDLKHHKLPVNGLANGLWIGEVPDSLKDLSWTEKMLIARIKHNACIVKVQISGMSKMKANVVSHSLPMPKIYLVCLHHEKS